MVLDAHFDVLLDVLAYRKKGERKILERRHLPNLKEAGISTLICSLYICEEYLPEGALRNALDQISALKEELEESESILFCAGIPQRRGEQRKRGRSASSSPSKVPNRLGTTYCCCGHFMISE